MKTWAEHVAAREVARVVVSERRLTYEVKCDPCGHHSCAVSAGCGSLADCCIRCPLSDCHHGDGVANPVHMSPVGIRRAERNRTIVGLREVGVPVSEIAEITSISRRRVWSVLAEL